MYFFTQCHHHPQKHTQKKTIIYQFTLNLGLHVPEKEKAELKYKEPKKKILSFWTPKITGSGPLKEDVWIL